MLTQLHLCADSLHYRRWRPSHRICVFGMAPSEDFRRALYGQRRADECGVLVLLEMQIEMRRCPIFQQRRPFSRIPRESLGRACCQNFGSSLLFLFSTLHFSLTLPMQDFVEKMPVGCLLPHAYEPLPLEFREKETRENEPSLNPIGEAHSLFYDEPDIISRAEVQLNETHYACVLSLY